MIDPGTRPTTVDGWTLARLVLASCDVRDGIVRHDDALRDPAMTAEGAEHHRRGIERLQAAVDELERRMDRLCDELDPYERDRAVRYAEAVDAGVTPSPDEPTA